MGSTKISYLVVGGCGFLGHHIVKQLIEEPSIEVSVLDLRTDRNRFPGATYYDGDITSESDVKRVLEETKPKVLMHTVSPLAIYPNKALFEKVNIRGTENLLECAGKSGYTKAFIFTSSASVVHDGVNSLVNVDESAPVLYDPVQTVYYSHTKAIAESRVLEANRKYGDMLTCAIRPSGIFGEGDFMALPEFMHVFEEGKHRVQVGSNQNMYDWTYVGNVAHAHILAAKALLQTNSMNIRPLDHEKVDGEAFFITNDQPAPFWDFPRKIWREAGWQGTAADAWVMPRALAMFIAGLLEWLYWIVSLGQKEPVFRRGSVRYSTMTRSFNISKAKARLGYKPIVDLDEGIKRGAKAYFDQKQKTVEAKKSI